MSAIGSVIVPLQTSNFTLATSNRAELRSSKFAVRSRLLPAALDHARHFAAKRELAEAQAAERELPEIRTRPAALSAAVPVANPEFRLPLVFDDLGCRGHS